MAEGLHRTSRAYDEPTVLGEDIAENGNDGELRQAGAATLQEAWQDEEPWQRLHVVSGKVRRDAQGHTTEYDEQ